MKVHQFLIVVAICFGLAAASSIVTGPHPLASVWLAIFFGGLGFIVLSGGDKQVPRLWAVAMAAQALTNGWVYGSYPLLRLIAVVAMIALWIGLRQRSLQRKEQLRLGGTILTAILSCAWATAWGLAIPMQYKVIATLMLGAIFGILAWENKGLVLSTEDVNESPAKLHRIA